MNIDVIQKQLCTGCGACANACLKNVISMTEDSDGFCYPEVDSGRCTSCGACVNACPLNNPRKSRIPIEVKAVLAKDLGLRMRCASGGVFSLLAVEFVRLGGVVFGVVWDETEKLARFVEAQTMDELLPLQDSKYVQAVPHDIYRKVRERLVEGKRVLFSGTPCQVYGLTTFLHEIPKTLTTVEVICMGVPSVKSLSKVHPLAFADKEDRLTVEFRNKYRTGWLGSCIANEPNIVVRSVRHGERKSKLFYRMMSAHVCQRMSCYNCIARGLKSGANLTIGDFWNVGKFYPEMDDDKGTSLVMINDEKGGALFELIQGLVVSRNSDYETALKINRQVVEQLSCPPGRVTFGSMMRSGESIKKMADILCPSAPIWRRALSKMKRMVLR